MDRIGFARWRSGTASGGNRYDDEIAGALLSHGLDLHEYSVTGSWPTPASEQRQSFAAVLRAEQHWLIDNIVSSAAPEAVEAAIQAGRRITTLVHYFPSDDPALSMVDRDRLARSEARAIRAASAVVATSEWTAREVAARYGRGDAVVAVPGVAPAALASGTLGAGAPPNLLWLGRLTETKDPHTLLDALLSLHDLDWTAQIVGPDAADPRLAQRLRDRTVAAGLSDRVHVTGPRIGADLDAAWHATDLLVHTARSEPYGMVVSEALARGIPPIVPRGTGAIEAQHGIGGTFPPGDAAALARLLRAWLTDTRLRQTWRAEAVTVRPRLPTWADAAARIATALRSRA